MGELNQQFAPLTFKLQQARANLTFNTPGVTQTLTLKLLLVHLIGNALPVSNQILMHQSVTAQSLSVQFPAGRLGNLSQALIATDC